MATLYGRTGLVPAEIIGVIGVPGFFAIWQIGEGGDFFQVRVSRSGQAKAFRRAFGANPVQILKISGVADLDAALSRG